MNLNIYNLIPNTLYYDKNREPFNSNDIEVLFHADERLEYHNIRTGRLYDTTTCPFFNKVANLYQQVATVDFNLCDITLVNTTHKFSIGVDECGNLSRKLYWVSDGELFTVDTLRRLRHRANNPIRIKYNNIVELEGNFYKDEGDAVYHEPKNGKSFRNEFVLSDSERKELDIRLKALWDYMGEHHISAYWDNDFSKLRFARSFSSVSRTDDWVLTLDDSSEMDFIIEANDFYTPEDVHVGYMNDTYCVGLMNI